VAAGGFRRCKSEHPGQFRCAEKNRRRAHGAARTEIPPEIRPYCHASTPSLGIRRFGSTVSIDRLQYPVQPGGAPEWFLRDGYRANTEGVANTDTPYSHAVPETPDLATPARANRKPGPECAAVNAYNGYRAAN
jgi:hypothetical protein